MSFIDLMADHRWSEADILNRTEAMVRGAFPAEAEQILNRKLQGAAMGFPLSEADQIELAQFQAAVLDAQTAGHLARADMALLEGALALEAAQARLALPAIELEWSMPRWDEVAGEELSFLLNAKAAQADQAERDAAQAVVDAASQQVLELTGARAAARAPIAEPEPEPGSGFEEGNPDAQAQDGGPDVGAPEPDSP